MALTAKRQKFVQEYLECFDATKAAKRADYKGNKNTLSSVGYDLLRIPEISQAIDRALQESAMSASEVLMRLASIARGENDQAKINDVLRALELIGKNQGAFLDKIEHSGSVESTLIILPSKDDDK